MVVFGTNIYLTPLPKTFEYTPDIIIDNIPCVIFLMITFIPGIPLDEKLNFLIQEQIMSPVFFLKHTIFPEVG